MAFTEIELKYLASQRLGRLATAQPNGTLQASPVGFRYNTATGRSTSAASTWQAAASSVMWPTTAGSRSCPSIRGRVRCVEIRGRGEAITDPTDSSYADGSGPVGIDGAIIGIHPRTDHQLRHRRSGHGAARSGREQAERDQLTDAIIATADWCAGPPDLVTRRVRHDAAGVQREGPHVPLAGERATCRSRGRTA